MPALRNMNSLDLDVKRSMKFPWLLATLSLENRTRIRLAFILFLAIWATFNWFHVIDTVIRDYCPMPHWDYWRVVTDFEDLKQLHLGVLWRQHNDHRILFPEAVFAVDMLVLRGLNILPLVVSFICYVAAWGVIAWALISDIDSSPALRWIATLLAGILLGWRGSTTVLGMPFLLQWTLLQLMALLALALIAQVKPGQTYKYLGGSIACAVVANYSAANGLLTWPILLCAGFILKFSRRQFFALASSAAISIGLFFFRYQSNNPNLLNFVRHPIYGIEFVASYLSLPFGYMGHSYVGVCFGFVSIMVFTILLIVALRNGLLSTMPGIVLLGMYVFALFSALMVASARMNPNDGAFIAAKAARYSTLPLITWAALISAAIWISYRRRRKAAAYVILAAAVLFFQTFKRTEGWVRDRDVEFSEQQLAVLSLESGIFNPDLARKLYPDPHFLEINLPVLQRNHLAIYSFPYTRRLLAPANSTFKLPWRSSEAGDVTQVYPMRGGLEVMGWAQRIRRSTYLPRIVFITDQGQIAGYGQKLMAGYPPNLASVRTPASIAWVGFLQTPPGAKAFSAYVLDRRNWTLGQIGPLMRFPDMRAVGEENTGAQIPGVQWHSEGGWIKNLIPIRVDQAGAPAQYSSSWAGSDQSTGSAKSNPITAPAGHCLVLPVLNGPSAGGISARILNADTGEQIAEIPMQGGDSLWKFWRVGLGPAVQHILIAVDGEGLDWGQRIAVSDPRECR
jgi:hypothetical protein